MSVTAETLHHTVEAPLSPEARLHRLWRSAGDLQIELERVASRDAGSPLTQAQIAAFNILVRDARELLPQSVALREDVDEMAGDEDTAGGTANAAAHVLRLSVVPTLHNALPDEQQDRP